MKSLRWWKLGALVALVVVVAFIAFAYWLSKQNIGGEYSTSPEERPEAEPPDGDVFPEFATSSPFMRGPRATAIVVSLRDVDNKSLGDAPYCLRFASGCWTCGIADRDGKTHEVFLNAEQTYVASTYEEAFAAWQAMRAVSVECEPSDVK